MPRTARAAPGGTVFHVLNRGVGRMALFEKDAEQLVRNQLLAEAEGLEDATGPR